MLLGTNIGDTGDDGEGEGAGGLVGVLAEAGAPLLGEGHQCGGRSCLPAGMSARARFRQGKM